MFDFAVVTQWIDELLRGALPDVWATLIEFILIGFSLLLGYALLAMILIFMERKVCAAFQFRLGPNRVGPWGLLQLVADVVKMLIKELIVLKNVDRFLFYLAPIVVIVASFVAFACIPFGKGMQVLDFNVGLFFLMAVSSVGIVGILMAGWSSNNKFALIGAMRSGAQMISYELSIGMCFVTMVAFSGSMQFSTIVENQADGWNLFKGHIPVIIAFLIYLVSGTAETNRGPFDMPEAESELTAGYHTEFSGMQYGFFYLAEYLNLFIISSIGATLFLGGWMPFHVPGWESFNGMMDYIPSFLWFFGKTFALVFIIMWFKWTFPRLRIDQLLNLEWKYLLPINLFNLVLMVIVVVFELHF